MLDIEKLLREGKSLDEIGNLVSKELNAAQTKIDAEKEAERLKTSLKRLKIWQMMALSKSCCSGRMSIPIRQRSHFPNCFRKWRRSPGYKESVL